MCSSVTQVFDAADVAGRIVPPGTDEFDCHGVSAERLSVADRRRKQQVPWVRLNTEEILRERNGGRGFSTEELLSSAGSGRKPGQEGFVVGGQHVYREQVGYLGYWEQADLYETNFVR